jgi:hypothetical protein
VPQLAKRTATPIKEMILARFHTSCIMLHSSPVDNDVPANVRQGCYHAR